MQDNEKELYKYKKAKYCKMRMTITNLVTTAICLLLTIILCYLNSNISGDIPRFDTALEFILVDNTIHAQLLYLSDRSILLSFSALATYFISVIFSVVTWLSCMSVLKCKKVKEEFNEKWLRSYTISSSVLLACLFVIVTPIFLFNLMGYDITEEQVAHIESQYDKEDLLCDNLKEYHIDELIVGTTDTNETDIAIYKGYIRVPVNDIIYTGEKDVISLETQLVVGNKTYSLIHADAKTLYFK